MNPSRYLCSSKRGFKWADKPSHYNEKILGIGLSVLRICWR